MRKNSNKRNLLNNLIDFSSKNTEVLGVSVDSQFSHLSWIQTARNQGGLGDINYPLVSDLKKEIATAYNVLDDAEGVALRGLFIIDPDGVIMHSTINNLPADSDQWDLALGGGKIYITTASDTIYVQQWNTL